MNKLDSTGFFAEAAEVCNKCGMHIDDANGCCRDEVKIIKLDEDQKVAAQNTFTIPSLEAIETVPSEFITTPFVNFQTEVYKPDHSPPIEDGRSIQIQNCVFRI